RDTAARIRAAEQGRRARRPLLRRTVVRCHATEAMLLVLMAAGAAGTDQALKVGGFILLLLVIVVASYRQTVYAYPQGGGAYFVAKENLGTTFGLVAAAALLVDYTLTVAVSVAAGVGAITR